MKPPNLEITVEGTAAPAMLQWAERVAAELRPVMRMEIGERLYEFDVLSVEPQGGGYRVTFGGPREVAPPAPLPCPFCGHDASICEPFEHRGWYVNCPRCHVRADPSPTKAEAINVWNRRRE